MPPPAAESPRSPAVRYLRAYTLLHRIVPAFAVVSASRADGATQADRSRA